jgi:hypothetical protein
MNYGILYLGDTYRFSKCGEDQFYFANGSISHITHGSGVKQGVSTYKISIIVIKCVMQNNF